MPRNATPIGSEVLFHRARALARIREAIASTRTLTEAAAKLGVHPDTLRRWRRKLEMPHGEAGRKKTSHRA